MNSGACKAPNIRVSEAAGLIMKVSLTDSIFPGLEEVELKPYYGLKHYKSYTYRGIRVFLLSLFCFITDFPFIGNYFNKKVLIFNYSPKIGYAK